MNHKEVIVIRIGLSIERADDNQVAVTVESSGEVAENPAQSERSPASRDPRVPQPPPRRSLGRGDSPRDSDFDGKRAMTDMQRKLLFRIAYETGNRDTALGRILEALGVERLEHATRAAASRAIQQLSAKRKNGSHQRANGANHD